MRLNRYEMGGRVDGLGCGVMIIKEVQFSCIYKSRTDDNEVLQWNEREYSGR